MIIFFLSFFPLVLFVLFSHTSLFFFHAFLSFFPYCLSPFLNLPFFSLFFVLVFSHFGAFAFAGAGAETELRASIHFEGVPRPCGREPGRGAETFLAGQQHPEGHILVQR